MVFFNLFRLFQSEVRSLPSTYEFKLKVNINVRWLHFLKIGYVIVFGVILFLVYLTGDWNFKETGVSSVVITVKGADMSPAGAIWDSLDYVYPPQEVKAFFITTRAAVTYQTHGICPDNNPKSRCKNDTDCTLKMRTENGIKTGKCHLLSGMCMIHAWCPVEKLNSNYTKINYINGASNFTVYVRNHEEFIKFNISRGNDPNSIKSSTNCLFNSVTDPTCPIFRIGDILRESKVNFNDVKLTGGVFQFYIKWHCYFNWNSGPCIPKYSFKRIAKENTGKFAGYKMRYANYQEHSGKKERELISVNGLRFLIMIRSKGEQFRFTLFLSSVGSYLSYFAIWTFITSILCAIFLTDKKDLLTLDENSLRKIVRNNNEEGLDSDKQALKINDFENFQKDDKYALKLEC